MRKHMPIVWFSAMVVVLLLVVGTQSATGSTGQTVKLGMHNCSGTVNDGACSGGTRTTSIDWNMQYPPQGNPTVAIGGSLPLVLTSGETSRPGTPPAYTALATYGSDWGAYLTGTDSGAIAQGDWAVVANGEYYGVRANASVDPYGVAVEATGATALDAQGAVRFSTAGLAIIPAGSSYVDVKGLAVSISSDTKILVTAQTQGGTVQRVSRNTAVGSQFRIVLTQPATQRMVVAYFVIS